MTDFRETPGTPEDVAARAADSMAFLSDVERKAREACNYEVSDAYQNAWLVIRDLQTENERLTLLAEHLPTSDSDVDWFVVKEAVNDAYADGEGYVDERALERNFRRQGLIVRHETVTMPEGTWQTCTDPDCTMLGSRNHAHLIPTASPTTEGETTGSIGERMAEFIEGLLAVPPIDKFAGLKLVEDFRVASARTALSPTTASATTGEVG